MSDLDLSKDFFIRLNAGSDSAAEEVDRRYRRKLCSLVEREMGKRFARREDPADPVQSALRSFFRGVGEERFHVDQESKLWTLLATITRHKILKHIERNTTRGRDPVAEVPNNTEFLRSPEPGPEDVAVALDLVERVTHGLEPPDPDIVRLRLEGHTRAEIADIVKCTEATVRLKLDRIRDRLRRLIGDSLSVRVNDI